MTTQIGKVLDGGLSPAQIVHALSNLLRELEREAKEKSLEVHQVPNFTDFSYYSILKGLANALNEYSPPFCYFSESLTGDFGFWVDWEEIKEAIYSGFLLKVNDLSEVPNGTTCDVLVINDHGNVTLYKPVSELVECWAIV